MRVNIIGIMSVLEFILSLSILAYCSASRSCGNEWQVRLGESCYKFLDGNFTWTEASIRCRELGSHLAIVTSEEENKYLKNFDVYHRVQYPLYCLWLDGKDEESETHWYWNWTGKRIEKFFWSPGQPSNSGFSEDCLGMYKNGAWNDFLCNATRMKCNAVCEKEDVDIN